MHVIALAGGVGGAKLVDGLARVLSNQDLCVIVNTGDDFNPFGLYVCPDLDTVCYTLAGIANSETGWGRETETWNALESINMLGGATWFRLGDRDLGLHILRTNRIRNGEPLSSIMNSFCKSWGVKIKIFPMSDQKVSTRVITQDGQQLDFQEYFVKYRCQPKVKGFIFDGLNEAEPAPGVLDSIDRADLIIFCPSNPWVSIDPILSVPGIREAVTRKPVVAVSPIIGGKTVKGPAAKMYEEMGINPSAQSVAKHYSDILKGFVFDQVDQDQKSIIDEWGIISYITNTIMLSVIDRERLASEILDFSRRFIGKKS